MKKIGTLLLNVLATITLIQAQDATPLSEEKFEVLRREVVGQSFDNKRIVKAKELSDAHYLYVNQIQAIMEGFVLESNRLEYAKYAYSTVLDAENYPQLVSMFKLGTAKEDLKDYIAQRKPPVLPKKETVVATTTEERAEKKKETLTTTTIVSTVVTPMSDQDFATAKGQLEGESFESSKLRRAKQISDANYLLCSQVKELLGALSFESSKLEYAKYAYAKTYDQANYTIVKEGVKHSKSKDEITAFLKTRSVTDYSLKKEVVVEETSKEVAVEGMSEGDFVNAKKQIASQSSDVKKLEKAKQIIDQTHLSTTQIVAIMELLLFEDNRLECAKYAYPKTTDQANYVVVRSKLEKESHKLLDDHIKRLNEVIKDETLATGPSELSAEDFESLKKRIKGAALESHKLSKAKTIIDRSKVSSMQVKQINELFELEESRLEFAKYAYTKVLNKDEYEIVRNTLAKSTSKYNLDRFIKGLAK